MPNGQQLTWAVGILTAPRNPPTLFATIESLQKAGFPKLHVFAEPGAVLPAPTSELTVVQHQQRKGPLRNFAIACQSLLNTYPNADCYAVFEDDVSAAIGLRSWCDMEFWPGDHAIISLYTSRVFCDSRPGWQTLNLGRYRTFGALALVFRKNELVDFLSDPQVGRFIVSGKVGADGVVGEWALKRCIGIAYHSPSLVQHEGKTSSLAGHAPGRVGRAIAVDHVQSISSWLPPKPRPGRVGLVGWNTRTGLGYQNRDIAVHLPVAKWLAPRHPRYRRQSKPCMPGEYCAPWRRKLRTRDLHAWLSGLDWLLFVEQPYIPQLVLLARDLGISVACVPNWEWLTVGLGWLPYVDLMICPTRLTYDMLSEWRSDLGFAWDIAYVPWPIHPQHFAFRRRERCRTFLFANGTGGVPAKRLDGTWTTYQRKGINLISDTAKLLKDVPFILFSQEAILPAMSRNVEVRPAPKDNRDLYKDGDVCVQPSHWEGLGLQLLECQAAGLPLVTTNAPPMNECRPFRTVAVSETELVFVCGNQPVDSHLVRPEALAGVLDAIYGIDLRAASEQARDYIERERSWHGLRTAISSNLKA
jgi:glycosyltransferase involved in cell wall biosynthesis